jgi:hypothetical protein
MADDEKKATIYLKKIVSKPLTRQMAMKKRIYRPITPEIKERLSTGGRVHQIKPKPSRYPETERMVEEWSKEARAKTRSENKRQTSRGGKR